MSNLSRRVFLCSSLAAGAGLAGARRAAAIEPIQRTGKSHLKLSIAAYSLRKYLDLKKNAKQAMTMDGFADFAVANELEAIEPTSYYFADPSSKEMARFRGRCTRLGLDISSTAIGNNFVTRDPAKLRQQIDHTKKWTDFAAILGAKTMRIFAGGLDKGDTDEEAARARFAEATQECCDHAAKYGVILALENHGGLTGTCDQILALVKAVKHDWFGVNLDTANFRTDDPYADLARLAPYAVIVQVKTEIHPKGKKKETADLSRLMGILRTAGYRGYVALEYEAAEEPKEAVPQALAELKKLMG